MASRVVAADPTEACRAARKVARSLRVLTKHLSLQKDKARGVRKTVLGTLNVALGRDVFVFIERSDDVEVQYNQPRWLPRKPQLVAHFLRAWKLRQSPAVVSNGSTFKFVVKNAVDQVLKENPDVIRSEYPDMNAIGARLAAISVFGASMPYVVEKLRELDADEQAGGFIKTHGVSQYYNGIGGRGIGIEVDGVGMAMMMRVLDDAIRLCGELS